MKCSQNTQHATESHQLLATGRHSIQCPFATFFRIHTKTPKSFLLCKKKLVFPERKSEVKEEIKLG